MIFVPFRNCWAIKMYVRRWFTPTLWKKDLWL